MRLITCSNSCPRWEDGRLLPRSPGGLVPMLIALLEEHGGHWIFTAPPGLSADDRVPLEGNVELHPLQLDEQVRRQHYDTISIGLFLGMLHYLHDTSVQPMFDAELHAAWGGYESVNRAYAKRLAEIGENQAEECVLINDPHLMLVPEFLAEAGERRSRLTYFLGTPWCEPDYFCLLPGWLRTRLLESLLHCDIIGFHAERWVDAFLACCERFLPDARVSGRQVHYRGRVTTLVSTPFPLDVATLEGMRDEPATARWARRLSDLSGGRRMLVRADRLDLWKNLPRAFAAYEAMLDRRPELAAQAWFVAVTTTPTRATGRHLAYQELCDAMVTRINARFAAPGQEAVTIIYPGAAVDSRNSVVAALTMSQAALVSSTYDGLNLFAKEAALLLPDQASLLLSVNAGVHEQLGQFAVPLDPFDIDQMSTAMEDALSERPPGSTRLAEQRRAVLYEESNAAWLTSVFGY
jgi:trehalose 6-phosphate synthase